MSAAGLSDVYRYGARFVGYLALAIILGGVFVAAGIAVGFSAIVGAGSLTNPSQFLTQLSPGTLVGSLVLVGIGVVVALVGVAGLLYKLIADASMTGTELALANQAPATIGPAATGDEAGASETAEEPETGPSEDADEAGATEPTPAEVTDEEPPEPTPVEASEEPDTTAIGADEGAESDASPDEEPPEPTPAEDPPAEAAVDDQQTRVVADESDGEADSVSDDSDLLSEDSETEATEAGAADSDVLADSPETESTDGQAATADTEPQEWSPPDPSEFDVDDAETGEDAWGQETVSPDQSAEDPRTTDDLFGDDEEEPAETTEDVTDLFGNDEDDADDTDESNDPLSDPFDS